MIDGDREDRCYICHRSGIMHRHHMLHGSRRKMADRYGLIVHLCPMCHIALHDHGLYDGELQGIAQRAFEEKHGHDEYMRVFGKNYIKED